MDNVVDSFLLNIGDKKADTWPAYFTFSCLRRYIITMCRDQTTAFYHPPVFFSAGPDFPGE
jgi:hypothetical protein